MALTLRQVCKTEVLAIEQPTRAWLRDPRWRQYVLWHNEVEVVATDVILSGLPFPSYAFDIIMFAEVVEHLTAYPESLLREMHRVLKTDGRILLTTPNFASLYHMVSFMRGRDISLYGWDVSYDDDPKYHPHVHEFTLGELRRLLAVTGFAIEKVHYSLWSVNNARKLRDLLRHAIWRILPHLRPGLMILARRV